MVKVETLNKILARIYYNPSHPASFSTATKLWHATKKRIPLPKIHQWLLEQPTYTLYKPVRRKFQRDFYLVNNIDDQWESDLNDVQSLQKYNDGYRYILTVIDVFSRYGWAIPLKTKSAKDLTNAFQNLFHERKPLVLRTDQGTEFTNRELQTFLQQEKVRHIMSKDPDIKCSIVERWNRTLKQRMWKYFTKHQTYRYVEVLPKLVHAYNHSRHSSIRMAPAKVSQKNLLQVWHHLYDKKLSRTLVQQKKKRRDLKVGQTVRISKVKRTFEKGYMENWSWELFRIRRKLARQPPVYQLEDLNNKVIDGYFYAEELQPATPPKVFLIDKILRTRTRGRRKEHLVRWKGYPASFDSWIPATSVQRVN
jgi:transposase InsO family protein